MSANLYWKPAVQRDTVLVSMAPSSFIGMMESVFGGCPLQLGPDEIGRLRAMEVAAGDSGHAKTFAALIKALKQHTRIQVYVVY